jgi:hypothetical protein
VFPARYELNSYIVFRKHLVFKRLMNPIKKLETKCGTHDLVIAAIDSVVKLRFRCAYRLCSVPSIWISNRSHHHRQTANTTQYTKL